MRETVIENAVCEYAEGLGWLARKMVYAGRRSCPDRWFFKGGRVVIVEFKRTGEKPDAQQEREHGRLRAAGFKVHVVDSIAAGRALFN